MIPAGAATIVPRIIPVAGVEHGINRIITVPAGVGVMTTGAGMIVPRISRMPVAGMEHGIHGCMA